MNRDSYIKTNSMVSPLLDEKLRREQLPVGWPWRFFLFSVLVAITTVVAYTGLAYGYKPFLASRIAAQDEALTQLGNIISKKQQDEFVAFYSQLAHLQDVLKNHVVMTRLLTLVEANTNTLTHYTIVEARVPERKVSFEGVAQNYAVFAEQLEAFTRMPEVQTIIVNDSNALLGQVQFRITLTLKPSVFTAP